MTDRRFVLVLGPHAGPGPHVTPADLRESSTLVVVAIGWPPTAAQDLAVEEALGLARGHHIVFDAILAGSPAEAAGCVSVEDRVIVDGSPREQRRIRRALAARGVSVPVSR